MQTRSEPTLRTLRSTSELESLLPEWTILWHADPDATPFQHPAWLLPWWRQFGQPDLRVVTLWAGDTLLALIPLYVLVQPAGAQMLLVGAGTSDYLDALVSRSCTKEQLRWLLAHALAEPGWDVAHLTQLRECSRLRGAVAQLAPGTAMPYPGEGCSTCPAMPVAALPAKLRSDVRYFRNAAIGHGKLVLRETPSEDLSETFDLLVRFHTAQWQERGEPGVLADPSVLAHHREALPLLLEAGLLRLMRLELAGEPVAVLYALADPAERPHRTEYMYLMGYAPEHRDLRPGMLLTALNSQRAAEDGFQTLDMLRGQESYKQFWRVEPRPTFGFSIAFEPATP